MWAFSTTVTFIFAFTEGSVGSDRVTSDVPGFSASSVSVPAASPVPVVADLITDRFEILHSGCAAIRFVMSSP